MNAYQVTYIVPQAAGLADRTVTEDIAADRYGTQATQGGGLIADFYVAEEKYPRATFSHVIAVKSTDEPWTSWPDAA